MNHRGVLFQAMARPMALLGLVGAVACGEPAAPSAPPPARVQTTEVMVRDVPLSREWVGEIRGEADIEIRARVQGFLQEIHFREGGPVTKGQLLYSIDPSELLEQENAAKAELAAARTRLANAAADTQRFRPLAAINAISQRDLDNAVAHEEASESEVEAAEAHLRLARIKLSYTKIHAPMDGLIGMTQVQVGDLVGQAPNPVVLNTVSRIDPVMVRFAITEQEYLDFARRFLAAEGPEALKDQAHRRQPELEMILADGSIHPWKGKNESVAREVDAMTGTLTLEASFPNPTEILRPGQYAKVRAIYETLENALLVPQRAVQEIQGQFHIWVVETDNTAHSLNIKPGPRVDDLWVINEGLEPGMQIVVEGVQRLRQGTQVAPVPYRSVSESTITPTSQDD